MADALQMITQSQEFQALDPSKRQLFLQKLAKLSPEKQQQLAGVLTPAQGIPGEGYLQGSVKEPLNLDEVPQEIKSAQAGMPGLLAGTAMGGVGAFLPKTAGPLLRAGVDVAANVIAPRANQAMGLEPGDPLAAPNWGDALNAAIPLAVHGIAGAYRGSTGKAQTALRESDASADAINQDNRGRMMTYDAQRQNAEDVAAATNTARQDALAAHNAAKVDVPAQAKAGIDLGNYDQSYDLARKFTKGAAPVDPTPLNEAAADLGVQLRQPVDPLQKGKYVRLTDALQEFGAPTEPTSATSSLLDASGRAITSTSGGTEAGIPLERVFATQKALGQVIGKTTGEEQGVARKLFKTIVEMLQDHAKTDPQSAQTIQHQLEGARSFMRTKSMEDFDNLFAFGQGAKDLAPGQVALNRPQIRTRFQTLLAEDPFFSQAFDKAEIAQMQKALDTALPMVPIGEATLKTATPKYPKVFSLDTTDPTTPVEALGKFPSARAILGKVAGGSIAGLVAEQFGAPTYHGIVVGGAAGAVTAVGPWLVARLMLSGPKGEQMVRTIMQGQNHVDSAKLAALTAAARGLGIIPNGGERE